VEVGGREGGQSREQLQTSSTRYYQVLNALIDKPEALAVDPITVRRLRRLRERRRAMRHLPWSRNDAS
jgi:hypothetical protein